MNPELAGERMTLSPDCLIAAFMGPGLRRDD
jgi:hypothetical protein